MSMFARLGQFVSRYWLAVVLAWMVLVGLSQVLLPRWDDVTYDGDLAYMPPYMASVRGERLLEEAFPRERSRSEIAVIFVRPTGELTDDDLRMVDRVAARLHNLLGSAALHRSQQFRSQAAELRQAGQTEAADDLEQQAEQLQHRAAAAWDEAIRLDGHFGQALSNRAYYHQLIGQDEEAAQDRRLRAGLCAGVVHRGPATAADGAL